MGTEWHIKELYYSNGMDIFGPVSVEAFSKNRYYRSTLIWYEGLSGWLSIEDCNELKHLIGTMHAPGLDSKAQTAKGGSTPPLSKILPKAISKRMFYGLSILGLMLTVLLAVQLTAYFNSNRDNNAAEQPFNSADSMQTGSTEQDTLLAVQQEAEKKTYRLNWSAFVAAAPKDFKQANIMGGISNLVLRLTNKSPYAIDSAKVLVSYIKKNGEVFKTETMQFDHIGGNSNKELYAPESKKGVKVQCKIVNLVSREMDLCYSANTHSKVKVGVEDSCRCQ